MSRSASHDVLFEPVQIGPRTLKNRLVGIPYSPGFGASKPLAHVAHRTVQAEGGWAAVFTGIVSPSESFEVDPHVDTLWDEDDERALAQQVKSIQGHGALAGVELGSAGGDAFNRNTRVPALAPSQLPSWRRLRVIPKEIEAGDIDRIQQELVRAARSALQAGCDIICVYGSFSYLPAQFLSPYFNRRTDRYGGSLENRARFWIEQLQAVRDAVGGEVAISSRIAAAGLSPIGISVDETAEFVRMADHLVDFWDVNLGALWARDSSSSRLFEEADQEEWTRQIKAASAKPVVAVGRYTDPDRMVAAIESGVCDLIGAARPRIADPFLPQKLEAGRYEDIRECTGANYCAATYHFGQPACIQNPTIGEEYRRGWHPERIPPLQNPERSFLVLGAGPAGMECALTLARRGARSVHLLDREPELGGFMRWATALPGLGQWARVVNWRQVQLRRHRRAVRQMLGTELDVAAVRDYGADVVILATGSRWAGDGQTFDARAAVPGADPALPHVLTPEQIAVEGKRPPAPPCPLRRRQRLHGAGPGPEAA
ncbi:MAG: NAD(P)-binding protein [Solirubrobacterales bacterium]